MDSKFVAPSNKMQSAFRLITNILGAEPGTADGTRWISGKNWITWQAPPLNRTLGWLDTGIIIIVVIIIAESGQRSRETTTLNI